MVVVYKRELAFLPHTPTLNVTNETNGTTSAVCHMDSSHKDNNIMELISEVQIF